MGSGDVLGGSVHWRLMSGGDLGRDGMMHKSRLLSLGGMSGSGLLRSGMLGCLLLLGRSRSRSSLLLVMSLRLGGANVWVMSMVHVGAVVSDGVVLNRSIFVVLVLGQRLEVQVSVQVVTVEGFVVKLMILSHAVVAVNDGVVVKRAVVSLGNRLVVGRSVDTPAVHGGAIFLVVCNGNGSVLNISLVVLDGNWSMLDILVVDDADRPVLNVRLVSLDANGSVFNMLVVNDTNRSVLNIGLMLLNTNGSMLDVLVVNDTDRSVLDI